MGLLRSKRQRPFPVPGISGRQRTVATGERIGQATDSFNIRWAALSTNLAEVQNNIQLGADVPLGVLGRMWVARDDARNFIVLGDPAVRLRVEDMPEPI
jgi:hypothetical protein